MIDEIHVRNLALIHEASMAPSPRLTVLTGETGAGKTALLSACKLLMGERADKSAVREGEAAAVVEGRFFLPSDQISSFEDECLAEDALGVQGCDADASAEGACEVVVTRRLSSDGRSRVAVNGSLSNVSQLARIVAPGIDLCGQHEQQMLARASSHRSLLDAWAEEAVGEAREAYRAAYAAAADALREYERVKEAGSAGAAALDEARFVLRRIDEVGLVEGEYEELVAYTDKAEHAESLARAANGAYEALSGEGGALDALGAAIDALTDGSRYDESLGAYAQSLREAGYVLEDVSREALAYREDVEFDPEALAHAQERLSALQGLMRSYGPRFQDVVRRREEAADLVSLADDAEERERRAKKALEAAEKVLAEEAERLHVARANAAPRFAAEVSKVMSRLEMGSAELICQVEKLPRASWTAEGASSVEFLFRPGSGMQARPLTRIASGGEMSRVMLSVHVAMGERDNVSTLVFDEVDAGVGGATAVALARVLADLSETHQVIAITHLPQVAVLADAHYVVEKTGAERPETSLRMVEESARVAEVARMLSGDLSELSLAHAEEMLASARGDA